MTNITESNTTVNNTTHIERILIGAFPSHNPTPNPITPIPSKIPTIYPTINPSIEPTFIPSPEPTALPTKEPTITPTFYPTEYPSNNYYYGGDDNNNNYYGGDDNNNYYYASNIPSPEPTGTPTGEPTDNPTLLPTSEPTGTPTYNPTLSPTSDPTEVPTDNPTLLPTVDLTEVPSNNPTLSPTSDPTEVPTDNPTLSPTFIPSIATNLPSGQPISPSPTPVIATIIPTFFPFIAPTPEVLPTLRPSYQRSQRLRNKPTFQPSELFEPTIKPTRPKKIVKTKKRIERIYKAHEFFLENSEAGEQIRSFLEIDHPSRDDINDLRGAINEYKNTLGKNKVWLFMNIDHVLQIAENYYLQQQLGYSPLNKQFTDDDLGLNHVLSVSGVLGSGNITNIINYDNKDITGIIGNKELAGITLVNITATPKSNSISAYFTSFSTALNNAIGMSFLNQNPAVTIKACDQSNNIIGIIYTNANSTSISSSVNGFLACSNWVSNTNQYILTNKGPSDCVQMVGDTAALAKCCAFLGLYGIEEEF